MFRLSLMHSQALRRIVAGLALTCGGVGCAPHSDHLGHHSDHEHPHHGSTPTIATEVAHAYARTDTLWPSPRIAVCWESMPAGQSAERQWVRDAIAGTWEAVSGLDFTGWGQCAAGDDGIRIGVADVGPHTKGLGDDLDGVRDGMVLNFDFQRWSRSCAAPEMREYCIRVIAVHEFGHAIGLDHEHNRADRDDDCEAAVEGYTGDLMIGAYDLHSVMNYCNPRWSGDGELSRTDIEAVQLLYGLTGDRFGSAVATCDFDGDGADDLAIGVPGEDVDNIFGSQNVGAVQIIYGGLSGLDARGDQWLDIAGSDALPFGGEALGRALATGDFDGDGHCDLAAGAPGRFMGAGGVMITYGAADGLDPDSSIFFEASSLPANTSEPGDRIGASLAAGDFDADGRDDLAIGVPGEDIIDHVEAGAVVVLYGSAADGLSLNRVQGFSQNSAIMPGMPEAGDRLGAALVAGDFDDDGRDDLAVGIPGEDIGDVPDAGAVTVIYSGAAGLGAHALSLVQGEGLDGAPEPGDRLGAALAAADIDDEYGDDLVIGAPGQAVNDMAGAGRVHAVLGWGRSFYYERVFDQDSPDMPGQAEAGDAFGSSLTAADFDGDGYPDVAVGVPGESLGARDDAGAIALLAGSYYNLAVPAGERDLHQDRPGALGASEAGDLFGAAVAGGDFDGDGAVDLAVGVPGEAIGAIEGAGMIHVFEGGESGLRAAVDTTWHQNSAGIAGACE